MNTRRFARTLMDAFPQDHWQEVITCYRKPLAERICSVLLAIFLGLSGAALLFHWLSK